MNDPPEIPIIYKPINDEKFNTSSKIDFIGFCTDVDEIYGDKLTYTWISNISGIIGIGDSIYNHILSVGYHNITLIVSDLKNASNSKSIDIYVLNLIIVVY